ncbi:MAG: hypothetical protein WCG75_13020, partial [Armatimonadota bacterium]
MPSSIQSLSRLAITETFDNFCTAALDSLHKRLPFALWMVTRTEGTDWIIVKALDEHYGVSDGDTFNWTHSFCCRMVAGDGPNFAPNSKNIPAYEQAPIGKSLTIESYMGYGLETLPGHMFGTLCAISPQPVDQNWNQHQTFVLEIKRLIEKSYRHEYDSTNHNRQVALLEKYSDIDSSIIIWTGKKWDQLVEKMEKESSNFHSDMSILKVSLSPAESTDHNVALVSLTLKMILGENCHVIRRAAGLISAIVPNCSATQLDAHIATFKHCSAASNIHCSVAFATRSQNYGLDHAAK